MSKLRTGKSILCLVLLLTVTLPLFLTGCHGARSLDPFVIPDEFDTATQYEITFWAKNDTNKTQTMIYQSAIADFMELYPNIRVKLRLYTDYGKIYNDVITNIATGTTPNVCITYPDHIATYLTGTGIVVPLDTLMDNARYGLAGSDVRFDAPARGAVIPQFLRECAFGGQTYALPFMRSTEVCYVNRTYVEKLGYTLPDTLTWDFMFEVAEAATAKDGDGNYLVNGQKVMLPVIYKSTDNMMIQLLRQKNAGYSTEAGEILLFNDTTKEILRTVAAHAKAGAFHTFKISGYPANYLNAGQCIFAVDSTAGSTWMGTDAPLSDISPDKLVAFDTEVMTAPQCDPAHPQMISQGPSVCIFNKADPQEVLASWLFMQYLLSDSVQIAYAQTEGYVPVTTKARETAEYRDYLARGGDDGAAHYDIKLRATKLLLAHTDDTFVTPVFNGSASLRDAAGQLIESVTKSVRRKETVDDAYLDKLFTDMTSLYRLNQSGTVTAGKAELGPLPQTAKTLLIGLAAAWGLIILYAAYLLFCAKRRAKKSE